MAEELHKALDVEAKLVQGWIGTYDVFVDGKLVFSKSKARRFPVSGEVISMAKLLQEGLAGSHS